MSIIRRHTCTCACECRHSEAGGLVRLDDHVQDFQAVNLCFRNVLTLVLV